MMLYFPRGCNALCRPSTSIAGALARRARPSGLWRGWDGSSGYSPLAPLATMSGLILTGPTLPPVLMGGSISVKTKMRRKDSVKNVSMLLTSKYARALRCNHRMCAESVRIQQNARRGDRRFKIDTLLPI